MVRFAAYTTDSDDDASSSYSSGHETRHDVHGNTGKTPQKRRVQPGSDDEDEQEVEDQAIGDNASDHSTDMYEDDRPQTNFRQARRRRTSTSSSESETSSSDSTSEPTVPTGRHSQRAVSRVDTTIIPWAQQIGLDAQRMHVMQTALFRMPEEAAKQQDIAIPRKPSRLFPPAHDRRSVSRKHSRDSEGADGLRVSYHRPSFAHDIDSMPFTPSRKYARVESADSAVSGNEGALVDAGLALGRSFRVGWGPGGTLVHLGQLSAPSTNKTATANSSIVTKTTVPLFPPASVENPRFIKLLEHHLSHTQITPDADGIPSATPSHELDFADFASLFPPTDRSPEATLYRLGHALFDKIPNRMSSSSSPEITARFDSLFRRRALSAWLRDAVAPSIETALRDAPLAPPERTALIYLSGYQISKAANAAADGGLGHLAALITQAGGDDDLRAELRAQLEIWREERADAFVDADTRRIYALLAGLVGILPGSGGPGPERCPDLNVGEGLDWKRAFGLRLWYGIPQDGTVQDVWEAYRTSLDEEPETTAAPKSWYIEGRPSKDTMAPWKYQDSLPDVLYTLIRLFADPSFGLSDALVPLSFGPSPSDVSMSWHLYVLLSRCMQVRDLGDREPPQEYEGEEGDEEETIEGHSPGADLLANSYATQLEGLGMIQEAVFVLLHIEGAHGRRKAIKDLLARNAAKLDDWVTRGIVGSLKIPMSWVEEAKAIYALNDNNAYAAYEHYLAAGLYNAAHEIAVCDLAPEAVIRGDLDLLQALLDRFPAYAVDGWHVRGKAFLDYANAMERLPALRQSLADAGDAVSDAAEADEVNELCRSVPKLLTLLPEVLYNRDQDPRHAAALADMSASLVLKLDSVRPLALAQATHTGTPIVDEATRLRHMRSTALERFMQSVELSV